MKRFISFGLGVVVLAAALAVGSQDKANGQSAGLVSSVLNKLERNHANLKSLRANISMEKYNSQLRDAEKYYGAVMYLPGAGRNGSVRIEWSKPQHEILSVSNGRYTLYRERLRVAYIGLASKRKEGGVLDLMYMSGDQLKTKFQPFKDVREEKLWGGISTTHLTLVPKGVESYKYAEVWVDASGMPVQAKIVERNDDATTIRLDNLEKNIKLSANEFGVNLAPDVKIIKS